MLRRRVHIANRRRGGLWWRLPLVALTWLLVAAPVVAATGAYLLVRDYARDLPAAPDLERWEERAGRTSRILAADGTVLAELPFARGAAVGHRQPVRYADLPPVLVEAILAAEDLRFVSHRGVDLRAVARASLANYRAGHVVEGASTITQQVARNLVDDIGSERSLRRKVREALVARRLERRYGKRRIFSTYANFVFLGANAYGVAAAARGYFDKELHELTVAEAALLAGLIQAPGRTDPSVAPAAARRRRDEVIARMQRAGFLEPEEAAAARAEPLVLSPPADPYGHIAPWITERARREIEERLPELYQRGGLVIETAAQPALAHLAAAQARAFTEGIDAGSPPQVGALVLDHASGYVEAMLGGRSWQQSQFDRASQACRQPGSAFKPIVYAAALEVGAITPGTPLRDGPVSVWDDALGVHWKPRNSGRDFRGVALAHDALVASLNTPAIDVLDRAGFAAVIDTARALGITSKLARVRPLALGASCVPPFELARAYTAFAQLGAVREPVFVTRVRVGERVLVDRAAAFDPTLAPARRLDRVAALAGARPEPAIDPRVAYQVSAMLRDVVRRGTGKDARALGRPAAGKTGTTNDNTDAWFVGYTSRVLAALWLGHDDPARSLGRRQTGGRAALPLWVQLVQLAEADRPAAELPGPPPPALDLELVRIDRDTGLRASPGSGPALDLYFAPDTAPTDSAATLPAPGALDFARAAESF